VSTLRKPSSKVMATAGRPPSGTPSTTCVKGTTRRRRSRYAICQANACGETKSVSQSAPGGPVPIAWYTMTVAGVLIVSLRSLDPSDLGRRRSPV
jgi:hypothetical protein